ncbi:MAG: DUF6671 family protein [Hyphococcus sp.]
MGRSPPSSPLKSLPSAPVRSPLDGRRAALATMHGKEAAIAPVLKRRLGLDVVVPNAIDTDRFGTFSGETPRIGTVGETALAKARAGMKAAGLGAGLASEGTYGAHPVLPFAPGGSELLVYVDDELGIEIYESVIADDTNFSHIVASPETALDDFLKTARFPSHGLTVKPHAPGDAAAFLCLKGIQNHDALRDAVMSCAGASDDNQALIETDMRAHVNPTRMMLIGRAAEKLSARLACACPACAAPGFGRTGHAAGLPCRDCGGDTTLVRAEIFSCSACEYREERSRADGLREGDPAYCLFCNP